jgi:amino acid permease
MISFTPEIIILRPKIPHSNDILMQIAQFAYIFYLVVCIPTLGMATRVQIYSVLKMERPVKKFPHFLVTFLLLFFTSLIAYLVPTIVDFLSCIGGLGMTMITVTIPGMCYYKLRGPYFGISIVFTVVLTLFGIFGAVLSFLDTIGVIDLTKM